MGGTQELGGLWIGGSWVGLNRSWEGLGSEGAGGSLGLEEAGRDFGHRELGGPWRESRGPRM